MSEQTVRAGILRTSGPSLLFHLSELQYVRGLISISRRKPNPYICERRNPFIDLIDRLTSSRGEDLSLSLCAQLHASSHLRHRNTVRRRRRIVFSPRGDIHLYPFPTCGATNQEIGSLPSIILYTAFHTTRTKMNMSLSSRCSVWVTALICVLLATVAHAQTPSQTSSASASSSSSSSGSSGSSSSSTSSTTTATLQPIGFTFSR